MALVVAVACRKGGCGKSTLAATLAATSVSRSFHTGTVDLDSQANLSRWALGREHVDRLGAMQTVAALEWPVRTETQETRSPLLAAKSPEQLLELVLPECVHRGAVEGLDVIPCAPHIHPEEARSLVLSDLPHAVVVVDTPPDISTYAVRSVLRQADVVISPVVCDPWSVDATEYLVRELVSVGRGDLVERGLVRFVVNMRQKTAMADRLERDIRKVWGGMVSSVVIPKTVAIGEASFAPALLTKKHPLWRVGMSLWADVDRTFKKRGAA
jgi:cellulose biosynthesis protein BcsQ